MVTIIGKLKNDALIGSPFADWIYGDGDGTLTAGRGGHDIIDGGGSPDGVEFLIGDAANLSGTARGGNDLINGSHGRTVVQGDAGYVFTDDGIVGGRMDGAAVGGNDLLIGWVVVGDCDFMYGSARGGNDRLHVRTDSPRGELVGDALSAMGDYAVGGDDVLYGNDNENSLYGDVAVYGEEFPGGLIDHARGGNDRMFAAGGDDRLHGDAQLLFDWAIGGDDRLNGGDGNDFLNGDGSMYDEAVGGDDRLHGGAGDDVADGEGFAMYGNSRGGNDRIFGRAGRDDMAGDGRYMYGNARGGNDRLNAGNGDDELTGDGYWMSATAVGGDDTLIGGRGADLFYFVGQFGDDVVTDFSGAGGEGDRLLFDVPNESLAIQYFGKCVVRISSGDNTVTLTGHPQFDADTDIGLWDVDPLV